MARKAEPPDRPEEREEEPEGIEQHDRLECVHYRDDLQCAAFPERIPDAILTSTADHRQPYPGDNGIRRSLRKTWPAMTTGWPHAISQRFTRIWNR
jgi:hypothetical protein